jgi:hypothetical protein
MKIDFSSIQGAGFARLVDLFGKWRSSAYYERKACSERLPVNFTVALFQFAWPTTVRAAFFSRRGFQCLVE